MASAWVFAGQGSQRKGMGAGLMDRFPEHCALAGEILGESLAELCLRDPDGRLRLTRYAQPALFAVNALSYLARLEDGGGGFEFLAGHSLGELNALHAAGCFDFETGLQLVRRRGELMAGADGGGMVAVVGLDADDLAGLLERCGAGDLDLANHNSATQVVLSGPAESLRMVAEAVRREGAGRCVPLNVSAPFHSRYMAPAATAFGAFLREHRLEDPLVPVIANATAEPYGPGEVALRLSEQIVRPVRWRDSMRYLIGHGVTELEEIGPGRVLAPLWREARAEPPPPATAPAVEPPPAPPPPARAAAPSARGPARVAPGCLGSEAFRRRYGVRYAYLSGAMYMGVASADLVVRMGRAGLMGFMGTGGLGLDRVEEALLDIRRRLGHGDSFGMNLLHDLEEPELELATVALYLRHDVRHVEAAAYTAVTPALVRFRFSGAHRDGHGRPVAARHLLAKVSRPEVAGAFMRPPPPELVARLVREGALTAGEGEVALLLPVSGEVCAEADSGGHTDGAVALALVPAIAGLRDQLAAAGASGAEPVQVGASGGLGAPEAVAAAFVLGADFVVTGSVNQCSPEAGTSEAVKDLLASLDVHDTTYAPAGDLFELGARVQVVRKGTLFPARANKLYQVYRRYGSLDEIDGATRRSIEGTYFRRSFEQVWAQTREHYLGSGRPEVVERAERSPKQKMALVFKWYFAHSSRVALAGELGERVNFQVHCGPAMGAFNRFVKGTDLEDWRGRHVDEIAERLMAGAAEVLGERVLKVEQRPGPAPG